jgi:hypothetical protein
MKKLTSRLVGAFERSIPGLKKFGMGAGVAAFLFPIATFAMGYAAGAHGLAAPQVDTTDLQTAASAYVPWIDGGEN